MDVCRERLAQSELLVGVCYYKRDAYGGAVKRFKNLLEVYPGFSHRDQVLYELAESLKALRKSDEALIYFQKIVDEFQESRYHGRAKSDLNDFAGAEVERTADVKRDQNAEESKTGEEPAPSGGK